MESKVNKKTRETFNVKQRQLKKPTLKYLKVKKIFRGLVFPLNFP